MKTQHFFLVSHGSRDPRSSPVLKQLAAEVQARLHQALDEGLDQGLHQNLHQNCNVSTQVWSGVLELAEKPLHQQIEAQIQAYLGSCNPAVNLTESLSIGIFPLFLQPGTHVLIDLPRELALAQKSLDAYSNLDALSQGSSPKHSQPYPLQCYSLQCYPYLGAEPTIVNYIRPQLDPSYTWICIAHGSSRPETADTFAQLHQTLGTVPAYLHHPPFLPETIDRLIEQGNDRIGLFPYFLFPGRLTDAIVATMETYKTQYPAIDWCSLPLLSQQIGFSNFIASVLWKNAYSTSP